MDTLGFPFWGEHKSGKENKICFLILEIDHFVEKELQHHSNKKEMDNAKDILGF